MNRSIRIAAFPLLAALASALASALTMPLAAADATAPAPTPGDPPRLTLQHLELTDGRVLDGRAVGPGYASADTATGPAVRAVGPGFELCDPATGEVIGTIPAPAPADIVSARAVTVTPAVAPGDARANAALAWYAACTCSPLHDNHYPLWKTLSAARRGPLPKDAPALLAYLEPALRLLARGADSAYCVWDPDDATVAGDPFKRFLCMQRLIEVALLRARVELPTAPAAAVDDLVTCLRATRRSIPARPTLADVQHANYQEREVIAWAAAMLPHLPAGERARFARAWADLPAAPAAADALPRELHLAQNRFRRLLAMSEDQRLAELRELLTGWSDPPAEADLPGLVARSRLEACLAALPSLYADAGDRLRQPLAQRMPTLAPAVKDAVTGHPVVEQVWVGVVSAGWQEGSVAVERAELTTALDCIEHGDAALADHGDPLAGKPFVLTPDGAGFVLALADMPRDHPHFLFDLAVGDVALPPAQGGSATAAAPSDF
jgi:hypothetical protein